MANIKFSKKVFEKEIGKLDEKMKEKISLFGTPLESITDEEIELEIFPNRPDLLSYQGFKRSFLAFLGKKIGIKQYKPNPPEKDYYVDINSSVENVRAYTACAIVKKLKLDENKIKELIEIQEKIHTTLGRKRKKIAIGIYPLEKIKLPITYKATEPDKIKFIPLEFHKEMSGLEILQKHPTGKEYAPLLAGKAKFPIFIDANQNILSMPPIINSELTGRITKKTKEVFIECSGSDFELLKKTLNIIVTTLSEMGGTIYQMELKYSKKQITPEFKNEKMKISLDKIKKILGIKIDEKTMKNCLEKMGHNYSKGEVEFASWRTDIFNEIDLIEDVAIAYGYENFSSTIPKTSSIGFENPKEIIKRKISEIFIGLNFLEISNYHLTRKKDQFLKMGFSEKQEKKFVEIKGSKTDYTILRKDLSHYLLKVFSENVDEEYPHKIFEIGKAFEEKNSIIEKERIAAAISPGNFTQVKQILEYFFKMIGKKIELSEPKETPPHFINGRTASIIYNNKEIGFVGEIHPKILKNWKIKMPVALFELTLDEILKNF